MLSILLGIYPEVKLLDQMKIDVNFLRHCRTLFHSGCTILHSHQQYTRVLISPHPHQHLLFSVCLFFNSHHPNGCEWYFFVVLICISLMISDIEHLFISLLAIVYLLWGNVNSSPLPFCYSFIFFNINLFERDKEKVHTPEWGKGAVREGERISSRLHVQHGAQSHDHEIMS